MTAAPQSPATVRLPIDPRPLAEVADPLDRGRLYNEVNLDWSQRQAVEAARRMVVSGTYPERAR